MPPVPTTEPPVDFFISYTGADVAWARWIDWQLRSRGHSTLMQAYDFGVGSNFVLEMQRALERCARLVAVWSAAYFKSEFCGPEIAAIFAQDPTGNARRLLPIRIEAIDPPALWRPVVYADFVGHTPEQCCEALKNAIRPPDRPQTEPPFPVQPRTATQTLAKAAGPAARFPGALPMIWNIPYSRNIHFTGRDRLLARLHESLSSGQSAALTQAVKGLGGLGKTQLALEYAYRYSADYDAIWWLRAEDPQGLRSDYAALAPQLGLPSAQDQSVTVVDVRRTLAQRERFLLVFDNATDARALEPYLPQGALRRVLITSRAQSWPNAQSEDIRLMDLEEATQFLIRSASQRQDSDSSEPDRAEALSDQSSARLIAELLGRLPLALAQAGAYILATGITLSAYASLLQKRGLRVLSEAGPLDSHADVQTTWTLAMEQIARESETAAQLLKLCSFLAPDEIALADLTAGHEHVPEPLRSGLVDELQLNKARALLRQFSLLEVGIGRVSVHRIVQWVTRERMDPTEHATWLRSALRVVWQAFPDDPSDVRTWSDCARLLPHARVLTEREMSPGDAPLAAMVLSRCGVYLMARAAHRDAELLLRRALSIDEACYGTDDPAVARDLSNLAQLLVATNRLNEAEPLMRRALRINEAKRGAEHPSVATDLGNLAELLRTTNRQAEAEPLMRRALSIDTDQYGADHSRVAVRLNNLALLLRATNRYAEAEPLMRQALSIAELRYGVGHPRVAAQLGNLANLLLVTNRCAEAELLALRALSIEEASHLAEHPDVATTLNTLAQVLMETNRHAEAEPLMRRALRIDESSYASEHPVIARDLGNLGQALMAVGLLAEAEPLFRRALSIDEISYGTEHPTVARDLSNLAYLLRLTGRFPEGEPLMRRALKIDETSFGSEHSRVGLRLYQLARLLQTSDRNEEAKPMLERALVILERSLGSDHPRTRETRQALGGE